MLEVKNLCAGYGGVIALDNVSLRVEEGEFVSIVGPNGAGKTTLFKTISGTVPARSGTITFEGRDLLSIPMHERPHLGIAHVPEGRQVFPQLTVRENLEMGAYTRNGRRDWEDNSRLITDLFPILAERADQQAGTLSGGQQQMLAIGRALMTNPTLLVMDEPSEGLAQVVLDDIRDRLVGLRGSGMAVLVVEQNVDFALELAERVAILGEAGRIVWEGSSTDLSAQPEIMHRHLGLSGAV